MIISSVAYCFVLCILVHCDNLSQSTPDLAGSILDKARILWPPHSKNYYCQLAFPVAQSTPERIVNADFISFVKSLSFQWFNVTTYSN